MSPRIEKDQHIHILGQNIVAIAVLASLLMIAVCSVNHSSVHSNYNMYYINPLTSSRPYSADFPLLRVESGDETT